MLDEAIDLDSITPSSEHNLAIGVLQILFWSCDLFWSRDRLDANSFLPIYKKFFDKIEEALCRAKSKKGSVAESLYHAKAYWCAYKASLKK